MIYSIENDRLKIQINSLGAELWSIVDKDDTVEHLWQGDEAYSGKTIKVGIKGFPYTVFWSTPDEVKFVCIEPWYGLPDMHNTDGDFKKKPSILKLTSDEAFSCQQTIEIPK